MECPERKREEVSDHERAAAVLAAIPETEKIAQTDRAPGDRQNHAQARRPHSFSFRRGMAVTTRLEFKLQTSNG